MTVSLGLLCLGWWLGWIVRAVEHERLTIVSGVAVSTLSLIVLGILLFHGVRAVQ